MPLNVEQHPCWMATCDRCEEGDNSEYGGSFHYFTEAEAREALSNCDWTEVEPGVWLCRECLDAERANIRCPHGGPCNDGCPECPPVKFSPTSRENGETDV